MAKPGALSTKRHPRHRPLEPPPLPPGARYGEPVRLILDGFPEPRAATALGKRHDAATRLDLHRRRLMREPRGDAEMYGALPVPAAAPAAFGVLFMHAPLRLQHHVRPRHHRSRPLGRRFRPGRTARRSRPLHPGMPVRADQGACQRPSTSVAFDSVPAFAVECDAPVDLPNIGRSTATSVTGARFTPSCPPHASTWTCLARRPANCARRSERSPRLFARGAARTTRANRSPARPGIRHRGLQRHLHLGLRRQRCPARRLR